MKYFVLLGLSITFLAGSVFGQTDLLVTEISWKSSHPDPGPTDGDWIELMNTGSEPLDLTGYLYDDRNELFGFDYAIFPEFVIQPGEVVLYVQEDCPEFYRDTWSSPTNDLTDVRFFTEDTQLPAGMFLPEPTNDDRFSGLSSDGDTLNIYLPTAIDAEGFPVLDDNGDPIDRIISITVPAIGDNIGRTWQWDSDGNFLDAAAGNEDGFSTLDANGSYMSMEGDVASPGYVEGLGAPRFLNQPHLPCLDDAPGDFDSNEIYECADVDALVAEIVAGTNAPDFDLTGDGIVDTADLEAWLAEAGAFLNDSGGAFLPGDANLDGAVDVSDFNIWNGNNFSSDAGWCGGDFNADGAVDVSDFNIWNSSNFQNADAVSSVPEPSGLLLLMMAIVPLLRTRKS